MKRKSQRKSLNWGLKTKGTLVKEEVVEWNQHYHSKKRKGTKSEKSKKQQT